MKRMSCCDTTAKILLIIFNCIFWAFGIAILGFGIWIKSDPQLSNLGQAVKVGDDEPVVEVITWLFIGAGIFVFAVGVVGMIGIIRESKIMMGFYIACVFIVFAAEGSAGIYAGVRKDFIVGKITEEGAKFITNNYTDEPTNKNYLVSKGFNYVQVYFDCCGVNNFMDYRNSSYLQELGNRVKPNATLSWACCSTVNTLDDAFKHEGELEVDANSREQCMTESIEATFTYLNPRVTLETAQMNTAQVCDRFETFECRKGCVQSLKDWTDENLIIMVGVGIAIGISQLILLFLALWFCQALGADEK